MIPPFYHEQEAQALAVVRKAEADVAAAELAHGAEPSDLAREASYLEARATLGAALRKYADLLVHVGQCRLNTVRHEQRAAADAALDAAGAPGMRWRDPIGYGSPVGGGTWDEGAGETWDEGAAKGETWGP